jgi:hypothetical protein
MNLALRGARAARRAAREPPLRKRLFEHRLRQRDELNEQTRRSAEDERQQEERDRGRRP